MARRVKFQRREGVALITLAGAAEGPRGAGFDAELRAGLAQALEGALRDPGLKAVVLRAGAGGWPQPEDPIADYLPAPNAPDLAVLAERLAHAPVPVVAVLSGVIAGGGLALSQAAGLRLALASTRFFAPEFGLGTIPAAGALVRLARRAGAAVALDVLAAPRPIGAEAAMRLGLCDAVASEGTIETAALSEALRVAQLGAAAPFPPREGSMTDPGRYLDALAEARARHETGPMAAIAARAAEVAEAALLLPFDEARGFEAVAFEDLTGAESCAALRHLAVARRLATAGLAGLPAPAPLARVTRVGLWNQPDRLVLALLGRGLSVQIGMTEPAQLEAAVTAVAEAQEAALRAGRVDAARRDADWERLEPVAAPQSFAPTDLVLATPARAEELAALRRGLPEGALLAIEGAAPLPGELGFTRAPGLAEIRAADPAQAEQLPRLAAVLRSDGGPVVHGADLGARLEAAYLAAAERAVMAGATPAAVDAALLGWGFAEPPFARLDRIGLGAAQARLTAAGLAAGPWLVWLGLEGRQGRASGAGVYDYPAEGAPQPMAETAAVLQALRAEAGIAPQRLSPAEIVARVLAELAGAGAAALQAGAAHRAPDLDLVAGAALGFPRVHGGPMFQADRRGLLATRKRLRALVAEGAPVPVTLWDVLIRNGRSFGELTG